MNVPSVPTVNSVAGVLVNLGAYSMPNDAVAEPLSRVALTVAAPRVVEPVNVVLDAPLTMVPASGLTEESSGAGSDQEIGSDSKAVRFATAIAVPAEFFNRLAVTLVVTDPTGMSVGEAVAVSASHGV